MKTYRIKGTVAAAFLALLFGCEGFVGSASFGTKQLDAGDTTTDGSGGGVPTDGAGGGTAEAVDDTRLTGDTTRGNPNSAGDMSLYRLSKVEYTNTLRDLFGDTKLEVVASSDSKGAAGFSVASLFNDGVAENVSGGLSAQLFSLVDDARRGAADCSRRWNFNV
jgi:Protein of unknown function (DUF1587)